MGLRINFYWFAWNTDDVFELVGFRKKIAFSDQLHCFACEFN